MPAPMTPQASAARDRQILAAAHRLLTSLPYATISMPRLEAASGLTSRSIRRQFPNKAAIFAALTVQEFDRYCQALVTAMVPFRPEPLRQFLIRYATTEPVFLHLLNALAPNILPALHGRVRQATDRQLTATIEATATTLDNGVSFFLPGDGRRFVLLSSRVLAACFDGGSDPTQPALTVTGLQTDPAGATQFILAAVAGMRVQATTRQAARKPDRWGNAVVPKTN